MMIMMMCEKQRKAKERQSGKVVLYVLMSPLIATLPSLRLAVKYVKLDETEVE